MAKTQYRRGAAFHSNRCSRSGSGVGRVAGGLSSNGQRFDLGLTRHHLHAVPVRILQSNDLTPSGPVECLDRGAFLGGQTLQICDTLGAEPYGNELCVTQVCDMRDGFGAGGSTDQSRRCPDRRRQSEGDGEPLHFVEIRR